MGFIALKCPSCNGNITLDDSRDFGFCQFCGTKIVQEKTIIEHRGNISVDHSAEINNLLIRAQEMINRGAVNEAEAYYNRVLDMDINNYTARNALEQIYKNVVEPNLVIKISTGKMYSSNAKVKIIVDKNDEYIVPAGKKKSIILQPGTHKIDVKICQTLSKNSFYVDINDRFTKHNYEVKCKFGNVIEIIKL